VKIVTVQFDYPLELNKPKYSKLLEAFRRSVRLTMPGATFEEHRIPAPDPVEGRDLAFVSNTVKLQKWVEVMDSANEPVIFADCDMLATGCAKHVFDRDFDVAYTARTQPSRCIINGGVIFAKPTAYARAFFRRFLEVNLKMFDDPGFHAPWKQKYVGYNQAAFGYLLENPDYQAALLELPCRVYNAVDNDWHMIDGNTVFVHIKGQLRRYVLAGKKPFDKFARAMEAWYDSINGRN
jgi:hypothetical protein